MSHAFEIRWVGLKELEREVLRLKKQAPKAFRQALFAEANELLTEAKARAPYAGVRSPSLRDSGHLRQVRDARGRFDSGWEVVFDAPHALATHDGIRGGFIPPNKPFVEWAAKVLGNPRLGYAVAKTVGERGLPPRPFLREPALEREAGFAQRMAERTRRNA